VTSLPSYDDLAALPAYNEWRVPVAFEDINGHMNVRHYIGIASEGLDDSLVEVGIPTNWAEKGFAVFSAEHHLTYVNELLTGDQVSVRVRLIGRSERAIHAVVYLLDDTRQQLAYVMEEVFLHIDMATRKSSPWPSEIAEKVDARVAEHAALPFEPGLSGSISLR
jgi:acyl-CoA thioester hydrolase